MAHDWARLAREYKAGVSTHQLAKKYDIHAGVIIRGLKARGVKLRPGSIHSVTYQAGYSHGYRDGLKAATVAKKVAQ